MENLSSSVVSPTHSPFSPHSISPILFCSFKPFYTQCWIFLDPKGRPCLQTQCSPMHCNAVTFYIDQRSRKSYSFHHCKLHFCDGSSICQCSFFCGFICQLRYNHANKQHTPAPHSALQKMEGIIFATICLYCGRTRLNQEPLYIKYRIALWPEMTLPFTSIRC